MSERDEEPEILVPPIEQIPSDLEGRVKWLVETVVGLTIAECEDVDGAGSPSTST